MTNHRHNLKENQDEIQNAKNIGIIYRASGNLFIAKSVYKAVPRAFLNSQRSAITAFSSGSGCRMRRYLRECVPEYSQMVTLTYPFTYPSDGPTTKNHLRRFLQELKREWERHASSCGYDPRLFSAFWFLEFQERGAPHFHIFCTWTPGYGWVAQKWYDIVKSEDIRHLQAGTRTEYLKSGRAGTISYASKYAVKMAQKQVPEDYQKVGRFWGVVGRRSVVSAATFISEADKEKSEVRKALSSLTDKINGYLLDGSLEAIVIEQGVRVLASNNPEVMKKIRFYVSRLAASAAVWENMFEHAEVD